MCEGWSAVGARRSESVTAGAEGVEPEERSSQSQIKEGLIDEI